MKNPNFTVTELISLVTSKTLISCVAGFICNFNPKFDHMDDKKDSNVAFELLDTII